MINKSINLFGAGDSIIEAPATLTAFQFPESTKWWEPVVFAYGGTADGSYIITGTDVVDVTISGFEVDGLDREPGSGHRAAGILLRNADGLVSNNVVRNMLINGSETFGIIAYGIQLLRLIVITSAAGLAVVLLQMVMQERMLIPLPRLQTTPLLVLV